MRHRGDRRIETRSGVLRRYHIRTGVARAFLLAAVAALGLVAPANAQLQGGSQRLGEPAVNGDDVEAMVRVLELDEEQREVLTEMHQNYVAEFTTEWDRFQELRGELMDEIRSGRNPDAFVAMLEKTSEFRRYRDRSRDSFFDDVKTLLLGDEQSERFPRYERTWRRMHLSDVDTGALSGGAVDLIELVERRDVPAETQEDLAAVLDRYEREFDEIVKSRMELAEDFSTRQIELFEKDPNPMSHMDAYGEMLDDVRELVVESRELTERYQRLVAAVLPEDERAAFEREFKRAYVPKVYGPSSATEAFDTAAEMGSLSDEQREGLEELRARYEREAGALNDDWAEALLSFEAERMTVMDAFGPGGPSDETLREFATKRRDLDTAYIVRLRDEVLTEEQREAIPDPAMRSRWRDVEFGG